MVLQQQQQQQTRSQQQPSAPTFPRNANGPDPQLHSVTRTRRYRSPTGSYILDAIAAATGMAALGASVYYSVVNWQLTTWTARTQLKQSCMNDRVCLLPSRAREALGQIDFADFGVESHGRL